jgi:hypothetical protein
MRCPTCNTLLGNRELVWNKEKEKIISDLKTSMLEKSDLLAKLIHTIGISKDRICCKMRIMLTVDYINDLHVKTRQ